MLTDVFHPRINGVSTSIETFCSALSAQGIRVTLVAPELSRQRDRRRRLHQCVARRHHAPPVARRTARSGRSADALEAPGRARSPPRQGRRKSPWGADFRDIDLVHVQTPFAAHYAGLRLARRRGHSLPCDLPHAFRGIPVPLHPLPAESRLALRRARPGPQQCNALDAVVVPSQAMASTLRDYGIRSPLHVIPTGMPESQFVRGNGERFRRQWGIASTASWPSSSAAPPSRRTSASC
jgi:1,2-diacylglycerol 3-alpha-glucosyltransferase